MATVQEQQKLVKKVQAQFRGRKLVGVLEQQAKLNVRGPVRGAWISQDVFKAPENSNLRDAFYDVVEELAEPGVSILPKNELRMSNVPFEWVGQRNGASPKDIQPDLTDEVLYERLCTDAERPIIILYCHGGAFYAGSPTYSRPATTMLAKLTKARVASVSYRLAPQNMFPAALLDLLVALLSLVYPASGSWHEAVPPQSIVLAGDSAGSGICMALIKALLQLRSRNAPITFNGRDIDIPLPAGVAVLSPFADLSTTSLPSWSQNAHVDFLSNIQGALNPAAPADEAWPSKPSRGDLYCDPSAWSHPLVSPALVDDWRGSPPIWMAIGEERCADGGKMIAAKAASQGVPVRFSEYMGMPHIFPMVLGMLPQGNLCFKEWAKACLDFCGDGAYTMESDAKRVHLPGNRIEQVKVEELAPMSTGEAKRSVKIAAAQRKPWTGPTAKSQL